MISSQSAIASANRFLDAIINKPIGEQNFEKNSEEIAELRDTMLYLGFNAPFSSLLLQTRGEVEEFEEGESADRRKQLGKIRELANSKKFTLNRARVALTANRIAADIFPLGREALIARLPVGGEYISMLVKRRDNAIITYRTLMELLEGEREAGKKVDYTIRYLGRDGWTTTSLKCSPRKDMSERVRGIYGKEARIVATRIYDAEGPLVGKRSARICLSIAYACLASDMTEEELAGKSTSGREKLAEYEGVLKKAGLAQGVRADVLEGYDELKEELAKKGFIKFDGEIAVIDAGILKLLVKKRNAYRSACARNALGLLALDVFRQFALRPKRDRKSSPYFPDVEEKSVGRLAKILAPLSSKPFELKNPAEVIAKKLAAEKKGGRMRGELFGAAFVYLTTDRSMEWCEQNLGLKAGEVRDAATKIARIVEARKEKLAALGMGETRARAKKFAELVGDAGRKKSP